MSDSKNNTLKETYNQIFTLLEPHIGGECGKLLINMAKLAPDKFVEIYNMSYTSRTVSVINNEKIVQLAKAGHKIQAIKEYRNITGYTLRRSKADIEYLMEIQHNEQ